MRYGVRSSINCGRLIPCVWRVRFPRAEPEDALRDELAHRDHRHEVDGGARTRDPPTHHRSAIAIFEVAARLGRVSGWCLWYDPSAKLIQELLAEGLHAVTRYRPQSDKAMRMHAQTAIIENGFARVAASAPWLVQQRLEPA